MKAFVAIIVCFFAFSSGAKLPDGLEKCNRNDINFSECLTKAAQNSLPVWVKGVPNLGFLPIDPLKITTLDINQGNGPVAVDLKFRDMEFLNLKTAKFHNVTADLNNYKIVIDATLDEPLKVNSDYEISGKVLVLPIQGKGKCNIQLDGVRALLTLNGKELKKGDKIYMDVVELNLKFDTTRLHLNFEGLFNNDKALGDNMNKFLNENWKEILDEVKPALEEGLGAAFTELIKRLFTKVPLDDIFLK